MIMRTLDKDIEHAEPIAQLDAARAKVAGSPMVWHALLLPVAKTGDPKFVLTGHIVCHDCELCGAAGDFRDVGRLVPWREVYGDCTDDDNEGHDVFSAYTDAITGERALATWAAESLRAFYFTVDGVLHSTGFGLKLDDPRLAALDEYTISMPEVAGSRVSSICGLVDMLYSDTPRVELPEALYLPPVERLEPAETAPAGSSTPTDLPGLVVSPLRRQP